MLCLDINTKVDKLKKEKRKKIFCPIWKDPWMSINSDTFISDIIDFCGGYNVFSNKAERYPKITLDEIINTEPDIILLPDEPYRFTYEHVEELKSIPKFNKVTIQLIEGTFHWHSFRMINSIRRLFSLFYSRY